MLAAFIAVVGVSAGAQISNDLDYRMDPGATAGFSSSADAGVDGGDLEFVFEDDGGVPDDDSLVNSGTGDLSGPMPTVGGDVDGAPTTVASVPLPASGGLGAIGLTVLAVRRRRAR
jgi:hypothetical protein